MGGVASAISDAFCSVASAVSSAVCTVVSDVGSVVCSVIQNPINAISDIAAVATGNPELIPLINGTITYASTGCATKALEGAAISSVTQGVGAMGCFGGFCGAEKGCVGAGVCVSSAPSCFNGAQCFGCRSVSNGCYCSTPTKGACTSYASNVCAPTGGACTASAGAQVCAPTDTGGLSSTGSVCTPCAGALPSTTSCVATGTCFPEPTSTANTCAAQTQCLASDNASTNSCISNKTCIANQECATMKEFCIACNACASCTDSCLSACSCAGCCSSCCSCCIKGAKKASHKKVKTAGLGKLKNASIGASPSELNGSSAVAPAACTVSSALGMLSGGSGTSNPNLCTAKDVIKYSNNSGADVLTPLQEGKITCSPLPTNTGISNLSPQMLQDAMGSNISGAVVDPTIMQDALQTAQSENIAPSTTFAGGGSAKCEDDSCGIYHPKSGCFKNPFCQAKMTPQFSNTGPEVLHGTGNQNSQYSGLTALKHIYPSIGSSMGLAAGGLPAKYHEAAPEGHHPEFITGVTGYYACGGGTGQSDDIPAMLHDGDYVMDAETVSALGDGSSKAGMHVLEGFLKQVPHKDVAGGNPVPAKIADGEYVFPAAFVTALGKGDNRKGSEILDGLREKLREQKRKAPVDKIPSKAKSPLDYIKKSKG